MAYICSKKMKQLKKQEPSLYVTVALMAAALLLFILMPSIAEAIGEENAASGGSGELTGVAASLVFYLPKVVLAAGFMALLFFVRRLSEQKARMEGLDTERMELADRELAEASPFSEGAAVYLTPTFLITGDYRFDVVPWEEMERCYYAGDLLVVGTVGQKAHVIAAHAERKPWVKALEETIGQRIAREAEEKAKEKKKETAVKKAGQAGTAARGGRRSAGSAPQKRTVPRPDKTQAFTGGLLMAIPGTAIWMLFSGFAIWGPLLGAMAMFYLISVGYGFGAKGLFVRHKDLGQWNPEEDVRPVLGMSFLLLVASVLAYHVILLVTGYPDLHYGYGYVLTHLMELLKIHNLTGLFRTRLLLGILMLALLGFRYGAAKKGGRSKAA